MGIKRPIFVPRRFNGRSVVDNGSEKRRLATGTQEKGRGGGPHNSRSVAEATGLLRGAGLLVSVCLSAELRNASVPTSLRGWSLALLGFESKSKRDRQDIVRAFIGSSIK